MLLLSLFLFIKVQNCVLTHFAVHQKFLTGYFFLKVVVGCPAQNYN